MHKILLTHLNKSILGNITLEGSKSLSNRVLIIQALSKGAFSIRNLSKSDDTQTLLSLLEKEGKIWNAHHAGTTFRFLTAYLSITKGTQILTGSERMKNRPIKDLVEALNKLGANIEYLEKEGYPPLKINGPPDRWENEISLSAATSSQFISALLLIAPMLPQGLAIKMEGTIVSRPYIDMTIDLMRYFGIKVEVDNNLIKIAQQAYQARDFFVEGDWSAASYYYIMASLSNKVDIKLNGLFHNSLQGDRAIVKMGEKFGIKTEFNQEGLTLIKDVTLPSSGYIEQDFLETPDLAQSVAVMCAGTGKHGLFSGLQTLQVKETDRIQALKAELGKLGVTFVKIPQKFAKKSDKEFFVLEGDARKYIGEMPAFDTYEDHRMAMSFASFSLLYPILIHNPEVVSKSYPGFWEDLMSLGFNIEYLE